MSRTDFLRNLGEVLETPADTSLSGSERLADLEGWNSLAMVGFIALADEHFGRTLSPRQFASCETVEDLCRLVGIGG
jgi:acyl carrier protein